MGIKAMQKESSASSLHPFTVPTPAAPEEAQAFYVDSSNTLIIAQYKYHDCLYYWEVNFFSPCYGIAEHWCKS